MKELMREIAGALMVVCFMFCYVPQIIKIFKNKSSQDVSLGLIIMSIAGYSFGIAYMFLSQVGIWWLLNYINGLLMCSILIWAWFKYKKEDS